MNLTKGVQDNFKQMLKSDMIYKLWGVISELTKIVGADIN